MGSQPVPEMGASFPGRMSPVVTQSCSFPARLERLASLGKHLYAFLMPGARRAYRNLMPCAPPFGITSCLEGSFMTHLAIEPQAAAGEHGQTPRKASFLALALGAVGVVYGDIGTSPLYALKESPQRRARRRRCNDAHGLGRAVADAVGAHHHRYHQVRAHHAQGRQRGRRRHTEPDGAGGAKLWAGHMAHSASRHDGCRALLRRCDDHARDLDPLCRGRPRTHHADIHAVRHADQPCHHRGAVCDAEPRARRGSPPGSAPSLSCGSLRSVRVALHPSRPRLRSWPPSILCSAPNSC